MMSPSITAPVPSSASFSLRRFFPRHGWIVVRDGGRFHSPPDEEDVGVEWSCRDDKLFSVLLRAEVPEEQLDGPLSHSLLFSL
jgi:hypothetical protein